MNKKRRQAAILKIVSENEVETQSELQRLLELEGISAAQSTLSRDIRELKISKTASEDEVSSYFAGFSDKRLSYSSIFAQSVVSMDYAQNIVVLKCHSGLADAACKVVDEQRFDSIVGTIAGDDTVFILTKTENHAMRLISQLKCLSRKE